MHKGPGPGLQWKRKRRRSLQVISTPQVNLHPCKPINQSRPENEISRPSRPAPNSLGSRQTHCNPTRLKVNSAIRCACVYPRILGAPVNAACCAMVSIPKAEGKIKERKGGWNGGMELSGAAGYGLGVDACWRLRWRLMEFGSWGCMVAGTGLWVWL